MNISHSTLKCSRIARRNNELWLITDTRKQSLQHIPQYHAKTILQRKLIGFSINIIVCYQWLQNWNGFKLWFKILINYKTEVIRRSWKAKNVNIFLKVFCRNANTNQIESRRNRFTPEQTGSELIFTPSRPLSGCTNFLNHETYYW